MMEISMYLEMEAHQYTIHCCNHCNLNLHYLEGRPYISFCDHIVLNDFVSTCNMYKQ